MGGFDDESDSSKKVAEFEQVSFTTISKPQLETTSNTTTKEIMKKVSTFLVIFTFLLYSLLTRFSHPLDSTQRYPYSLKLSLLAMVVFIAFTSSVAVMIYVGARFSRIQIMTLLVSIMTQLISSFSSIVFLMYVPVIAVLFSGWYASANSRRQEIFQSM